MSENWLDLKLLNNDYKNIISKYFDNVNGKYKIIDNVLIVDIENWGIENFYINGLIKRNDLYNIEYEYNKKIYDIAISVQIGSWDTFKKIEIYLENFNKINVNFYFVIINIHANLENINYLKNKYPNSVILNAENRGMDIGLFLLSLYYIKINKHNHEFIIKIHTKTNDNFRNETLQNIMGSNEIIINNFKKLCKDDIGIISGNTIYKYSEFEDAFNDNYYHLEKLIKYLYNEDINKDNLEFVAGTMFIAKINIFNILNIVNIDYIYNKLNNSDTLDYYWYSVYYKIDINDKKKIYDDYYNNKENRFPNNIAYCERTNRGGLRDCMIEHAIERLFGYLCKNSNMEII
jgi:hypothetical protein